MSRNSILTVYPFSMEDGEGVRMKDKVVRGEVGTGRTRGHTSSLLLFKNIL